ncbi:MAG: hypothetical protein II328_01940, partial [Clostridia bacterium]|nr:hypothetical protein [Clostridia bacterium]
PLLPFQSLGFLLCFFLLSPERRKKNGTQDAECRLRQMSNTIVANRKATHRKTRPRSTGAVCAERSPFALPKPWLSSLFLSSFSRKKKEKRHPRHRVPFAVCDVSSSFFSGEKKRRIHPVICRT